MTRSRLSIADRLAQAQLALDNALANREIAAALAAYGYTPERLREGAALLDNVRALSQRQRSEYVDLFAAKDTLQDVRQQAHDNCMRYVSIARVAFKGQRGTLEALGIAEQRKKRLAPWLAQAQQFYANALADSAIQSRLAAFGITNEMLLAGQRQVDAVSGAASTRGQRRARAKDATRQRDATLAALDAWMADFRKIARVALRDRPGQLEKLGLAAHGGVRRPSTPPSSGSASAGTLTPPEEGAAVLSAEPSIAEKPAARRNGRTLVEGNGVHS